MPAPQGHPHALGPGPPRNRGFNAAATYVPTNGAVDQPALDLFNSGANQNLYQRDGWDKTLIASDGSLFTDSVPSYASNGPFSTVLDSFNTGASQALTARAGWNSGVIKTGDSSHTTDIVPTKAVQAAVAQTSNYWNTSLTDTEVWTTVTIDPVAAGTSVFMCARITPGATPTYYALDNDFSGSNQWNLMRMDTSGRAVIAGPVVQVVSAGDSMGLRCIGTTIEAWYRPSGGAWRKLLTATDATYASGFFGFISQFSGTMAYDSFGGGAPVEAFNFWGNRADNDESVWVKFANTPDNFFWLWDRAVVTAGGVTDGYFLYCHSSGYGELWRKVGGVTTVLNSGTKPTAWSTADRVMLQTVGTTLTAYWDSGDGYWTPFITVEDASLPAGGFIGLQVPAGTTTQFDSFGGGPFTSVSIPTAVCQSRPYAGPRSLAVSTFDSATATVDSAELSFASQPPLISYSAPGSTTMGVFPGPDFITITTTASSPPRETYCGPRSQTLGLFDPAYNTFADWTPPPSVSRSVPNYSSSRSSTLGAFYDNAQVSLTTISTQARPRPVMLSRTPGVFDSSTAAADSYTQTTQSRQQQRYTPPQSRTMPTSTLVCGLFPDDMLGPDTGLFPECALFTWTPITTQARNFYPRPPSVVVNVYDSPTVAADTWTATITSRPSARALQRGSVTILTTTSGAEFASTTYSRQATRALQRGSLTLLTGDNTTVTPDSYAFTTQSRRVPAFAGRASVFEFALDGPSGLVTDPGGGGYGAVMGRGFFERYSPKYEAGYEPRYKPTLRKQKV